METNFLRMFFITAQFFAFNNFVVNFLSLYLFSVHETLHDFCANGSFLYRF